MFKQHLEMIGRNETPSKKAKFWQSYVRSLKGSDDIRAHETPKVNSWRPLSTDLAPLRSIYDEPSTASERIVGAGYRYLPVHRDTYGYSPRPIYTHHYGRPSGEYAHVYDAERAWNEHLQRMKEIERRYPSRYGLYLKDKPNTVVVPLEYEPEDKPIKSGDRSSPFRALSVQPPAISIPPRSLSVPPRDARATSVPRFNPLSPLDILSEYERAPFQRALSPTPIKNNRWGLRDSEVAYDLDGLPIYRGGFPRHDVLDNIMNPRASLPPSAITTDPFWYDLGDLNGLRPFRATSCLPPSLRDSYLSPIKRRYLWTRHPVRPYEDELDIP